MRTADVIHRSVYIIHDCCLEDITEHCKRIRFPAPCFHQWLFLSLWQAKKKKRKKKKSPEVTWFNVANEARHGKNKGRHHTILLHLRRVWSDHRVGPCRTGQTGPCKLWSGEKKSSLSFFKSSQTRSLCGDFGWKTERRLSWIPSTQRHILSLSAVWLRRQLQGTVLPLKEGCSAAIPGSGKDWRQIAS